MSKVTCSRLFHIFQNIPLKYTPANYPKTFTLKVSIEGRGIFEKFVTNRKGHKMYNKQILSESLTNGKKTEKLLFCLLDNPTLNANFK